MLKTKNMSRRASMLTVLFVGSTLFAGCSSMTALAQPLVTIGGTSVNQKDSHAIDQALDQLAARYDKQPVSVHKDYSTNTIIGDMPGKKLDREATKQRLLQAHAGDNVQPVLKDVPADVTIRQVATETPFGYTKLADYSTRLPANAGYLANIKLAADFITDSVVLPGQTLSFNNATGFPTKERGYQPGPGIDNGKVVDMYGGGICQVSTTLYNAVAGAGLDVVERHSHSLPVSYVPTGKDAMVYIEEGKDFIFKNNRPTPVIVKSQLHDGVITVTIYGK